MIRWHVVIGWTLTWWTRPVQSGSLSYPWDTWFVWYWYVPWNMWILTRIFCHLRLTVARNEQEPYAQQQLWRVPCKDGVRTEMKFGNNCYVTEKTSGPGNLFISNEQATKLTKDQFVTNNRINKKTQDDGLTSLVFQSQTFTDFDASDGGQWFRKIKLVDCVSANRYVAFSVFVNIYIMEWKVTSQCVDPRDDVYMK